MILKLRDDFRSCFEKEDIFDAILNLDGEIYRRHKNRRTIRITKNGKRFFVKIHMGVSWREIFKNIFQLRLPVWSSLNEVRAIKRLEELEISTMKLSGFGMRGLPPAWLDSFVITEELENTISLEDLCRDWKTAPSDFALKSALIRKVAGIAAAMHRNGVNHRDFYLCHFILNRASLEKARQPSDSKHSNSRPPSGQVGSDDLIIYLIDLHRVQLRKKTPERWIIKDLAGLLFSSMDIGLTKRDIFRFMIVYTGKPLHTILKEDRLFWIKIYRKATRLYLKHFKCNSPLAEHL